VLFIGVHKWNLHKLSAVRSRFQVFFVQFIYGLSSEQYVATLLFIVEDIYF